MLIESPEFIHGEDVKERRMSLFKLSNMNVPVVISINHDASEEDVNACILHEFVNDSVFKFVTQKEIEIKR